ncbi:hypothetical protein KM043_003407 [Ampulex compressa]|nr:hypothetical protein KM043_003407 [Ampulex compressa]
MSQSTPMNFIPKGANSIGKNDSSKDPPTCEPLRAPLLAHNNVLAVRDCRRYGEASIWSEYGEMRFDSAAAERHPVVSKVKSRRGNRFGARTLPSSSWLVALLRNIGIA